MDTSRESDYVQDDASGLACEVKTEESNILRKYLTISRSTTQSISSE